MPVLCCELWSVYDRSCHTKLCRRELRQQIWQFNRDWKRIAVLKSALYLCRTLQHHIVRRTPHNFVYTRPQPEVTTTEHAPDQLPVIRAGPLATENVKLAAVSGCQTARLLSVYDSWRTNHRYVVDDVFRGGWSSRTDTYRVGRFGFKLMAAHIKD